MFLVFAGTMQKHLIGKRFFYCTFVIVETPMKFGMNMKCLSTKLYPRSESRRGKNKSGERGKTLGTLESLLLN